MRTFKIETLGCKVNEYESAYYIQQLEEAGFRMAEEGEPADVLVINTCTVTNTAAAKSRRKIGRLRRENPGAISAACGCYVQVSSPEERQALGVDLLIGAAHKDELAERIISALDERDGKQPDNAKVKAKKEGKSLDLVEEAQDLTRFESMPIGHFEGQHRAFLKIQDGCNQYCAYCQIPLARGPERSQIPADVIESAKHLAQSGHQEIVLTGIHTGRYHFRDTNLTQLLAMLLEETPENVCYHLSSIEITEVTDELLDLMEKNPRILPHLHIPIQAGDDRTLARMKRPYTTEYFKTRLEEIRRRIPRISISTDVITGFVGETDDEFETTVQTLKDCAFSFLHVFPYSRRKGTAADSMTGFVPGPVSKQRADVLLDLSKTLREADMKRFDCVEALIEREDPHQPGVYIGYSAQYHPVAVCSKMPLSGRIDVRISEIDGGRYVGRMEESK